MNLFLSLSLSHLHPNLPAQNYSRLVDPANDLPRTCVQVVLAAGSVETIPSLFSIERDEERSSKTRRKEAISWRTSHIERRSITVNNRGTMESGEERREGGRKTLEDWRDARPDRLACSPTPTVPACTVVPCSGLSSYRFVCFVSRSGWLRLGLCSLG